MTRPTSFSFPYQYIDVDGIGSLFYPIVTLEMKTLWGWQAFDFLVDTGADVTTLPSFAFGLFGVKKENLQKSATQGIGGISIDTWSTTIHIKIGKTSYSVSSVITQDGNTPLLLGKKDIFDGPFSLYLDAKKKETVLIHSVS